VTSRRTLLLAAMCFSPLIPLLVVGPTLLPSGAGVVSAATAEGYNTAAAWNLAMLWAALVVALWVVLVRRDLMAEGPAHPARQPTAEPPIRSGRRGWELAVVAALVIVALWPPALAWYGPFIEDSIFLQASHRMLAGLHPFRDFEFLYGPAMIGPLRGWLGLTGWSPTAYYSWLLLLELAIYLGVLAMVQRWEPRTGRRVLVFLLLVPFLVNPMLGLNSNALRRLLPVAVALGLALEPRRAVPLLGFGTLLGLAMAYSHDYAAATALGAVVMYAAIWWFEGGRPPIVPLLLFGVSAVVSWILVSIAFLGPDFPAYLAEVRGLIARYGAGEAGFRFYWTLNALAFFGLLTLGLVALGQGIGRRTPGTMLTAGDRMAVLALAATLILLKSGINRSDVWHLMWGATPLLALFVVPLPRGVFRWSPGVQGAAWVLIGVMGFTKLVGDAPLLAHYARGLAQGWRVELPGAARPPLDVHTELPAVELGRAEPDPGLVSLARHFAAPERRGQTVYFYGTLWSVPVRVGLPKRDPLNDDFIFSDARGAGVREWLVREEVPWVVIDEAAYLRLFDLPGADPLAEVNRRMTPSLMKTLGGWLSTVHYHGVMVELPLKDQRWARLIGGEIRAGYEWVDAIGRFVILRRRTTPAADRPTTAEHPRDPPLPVAASPATPIPDTSVA